MLPGGLQERHARLLRWLLIIGWLALIVSLLIPASPLPGNRIFWGTVVPSGLLLIAAISHELWRRLCPLAFVSQLAHALGLQRSRPGKGNRPELVLIKPDSWLGRHHVQLQWSLLIAGLCLRLLGGNSDPIWLAVWLAVWLVVTLLAAVAVGWAYGGKSWCKYFCPMGPVQTVLTGVRGPLGSPAHVGPPSKITQSICRTITAEGQERSACVVCQSPCLDIDAERQFWQNLERKRGLAWAWYSYPGLVLACFTLMEWSGHGATQLVHPLGYIRSGQWALDRELVSRAWQPLPHLTPLPRLLVIPIAITTAAWLSVIFWRGVEGLLLRQSLQLDDENHHAVIDLLAKEHPELLGRNRFERQGDDLRRGLALTNLGDFLLRNGFTVFDAAALNPRQRQELERLRLASGLPEPAWESVLRQSGPQGELERQRLEPLRAAWLEEAGLLAWVLMLERQRHPEAVARRLQDPRPGLASSPFLQGQLRGDSEVDEALLAAFTGWSMFADVLPAGLLWLAQRGTVRQLPAGQPVMEKGSISDHLALVLGGDVQVLVGSDETVLLGPGQAIGEIGVLTGRPRTASVWAGANGCRLLLLPCATFEELLRRSDSFSRSLLSQLALRLVDARGKLPA